MTYKNDPRMITAKFTSACSKCGCSIKKGTDIYYWPSDRKAYCEKCGEKVLEKVNVSEKIIAPPEIIQENQNDPSSRLIEIRKDGNYIDNILYLLEEIVKKGQE